MIQTCIYTFMPGPWPSLSLTQGLAPGRGRALWADGPDAGRQLQTGKDLCAVSTRILRADTRGTSG
jgi:hypothetical protein